MNATIATINRPNKWTNSWGFTTYNGTGATEYTNGFETRQAAIEALNTKFQEVEIMSGKAFDQKVDEVRSAEIAKDYYRSMAKNG